MHETHFLARLHDRFSGLSSRGHSASEQLDYEVCELPSDERPSARIQAPTIQLHPQSRTATATSESLRDDSDTRQAEILGGVAAQSLLQRSLPQLYRAEIRNIGVAHAHKSTGCD